jgi:hypothetical protein
MQMHGIVAYLPHAGAVEVQKPQWMWLCNSSGTLPSHAFPPFPSLRSASCVARLHGKLDRTTVRGHVTSATSHAIMHSAAFSHMSDFSVCRKDWRQYSQFSMNRCTQVSCNREFKAVRKGEFTTNLQSVIGMIWEDCFCEEKIYMVYLKRKTVIVCASRSVARRQLVERDNPSACATVHCKLCIWERVLYCLCVSVITSNRLTQLVINPIIRTTTRLISDIHVTFGVRSWRPRLVWILKEWLCPWIVNTW